MSQLVRLEGKHTAQTAHCAVHILCSEKENICCCFLQWGGVSQISHLRRQMVQWWSRQQFCISSDIWRAHLGFFERKYSRWTFQMRWSSEMSGRSTTLISYEPEIVADNTDGDDGQLAKLQEKVKNNQRSCAQITRAPMLHYIRVGSKERGSQTKLT